MPPRAPQNNMRHPAAQDKAEAAAQEKTDARWWLGGAGGAATMNGARNRDITAFWQHAEESHADVRSNLNEVRHIVDSTDRG